MPLVHVTHPPREVLSWKKNYIPGGLLPMGPTPTKRKTEGPLASWVYRCREMSQQAREGNNIHCLLGQELSPSFGVLFSAGSFPIRSFHLLAIDRAGYMNFEKMPASSCFLGGHQSTYQLYSSSTQPFLLKLLKSAKFRHISLQS